MTIFDKINISYSDLRKKANPIKSVTDYYKSKLLPGQELWWIQDTEKSSKLVINIWNNLSTDERQEIKLRAMIFFPEIFGNSSDKFSRLAIWLITREAIVCPNIRDNFSAGGQGNFQTNRKTFYNVPRIYIKLFENIHQIVGIIAETSTSELSEFWNKKNESEI